MFANAKQRLKNETTQTLEDGPTDLISGTATDSLFFFFFFCLFLRLGQLIVKPLSLTVGLGEGEHRVF